MIKFSLKLPFCEPFDDFLMTTWEREKENLKFRAYVSKKKKENKEIKNPPKMYSG